MDDIVDWMTEHSTSMRFYAKGMNSMVAIASRIRGEENTTFHNIEWGQDLFPAIKVHRLAVEVGSLGD